MTKKDVAKILNRIADLLEIKDENSFKIRAYRNASRAIESIENLEDINSKKIKNIGKSTLSIIKEIIETGTSNLLETLQKEIPEGVQELLNLKGLGAKRIKILYRELGITSIGELEYACKENRLLILKGFGKKIQENILNAIKNYRKNLNLFTIAEYEEILNEIRERAKKENIFLAFTGDYRRKCEVYSKLEFITFKNYEAKLTEICKNYKKEFEIYTTSNRSDFIRKLFLTTGSREFVEKYNIPEEVKSEVEIFKFNNSEYIIPEMREDNPEFEKNYLRYCDIKGIFHVHTTYSDGTMSIEDIVKYLISRGYKYVGISDHSKSAYYANGLTEDDIKKQHEEIERLNEKYAPFKIFKGIESDILKDGSLDYPDNILEKFDFVIASVHSSFNMSKKDMTNRIINAIKNPFTTILGHPTGRLLTVRDSYEIDMDKVLEALAEFEKSVEINAQPFRLDIDWRWAIKAKKMGIKFFICPDAHNLEDFDYVKYGINIARKAGLTKKDVLNSQEKPLMEMKILKD